MIDRTIYKELLTLPMDYSTVATSCSPFYSTWGLLGDGEFGGIRKLVIHYNRSTRAVWDPFVRMPGKPESFTGSFDGMRIKTDCSEGEVCFYDRDAFVVSCRSTEPVEFFCRGDEMLAEHWIACQKDDILIYQGYSRNPDKRDPDAQVAFLNGLWVVKGILYNQDGRTYVEPDVNGEIYVAFAAMVMDISREEMLYRLAEAPAEISKAHTNLAEWVQECMGSRLNVPDDSQEKEVFYRAVSGLLMNLTIAPGYLKNYISAFPNRGGYPTHFLWDSAFQNLAYERMNPKLAKHSILQLTENIRPDGRISHFQCSTWSRPAYSQPALVGWMVLRYLDEVDGEEKGFIERVFTALEANNNWWLNQRMTRFGLLYCDHGLETGQDDSVRFDNGTIMALDINSYVVNQMRCTAELGRRLGLQEKAKKWDTKADEMAALMVALLYDPQQNLFFDADAYTGERQNQVTASAFFPLWCGVPLEDEKVKGMINDWLLNLDKFFGKFPFPSVAYDQPGYQPHKWWRGPVWLSVAWILLEVLKKYGFTEARREAMKRLYDMMLKDGLLHELFNSQTGEGMGNAQQGWTAAIFLRIGQEMRNFHT